MMLCFHLDKPICRSDQKRIYGVARHEVAKILCEVESYPPPDSFKWSFNNSAESKEVPQTRFNSGLHHFSSMLSYTPVGEFDYGTIMCWANNLAGMQAEPCVFHVIAAGKPDPPVNCSLLNQTSNSLVIECVEGFDGGQPQYFLLELYDQQTGILQANVSAKFPLFIVNGLESGKILKMLVFAANGKGKSEAVLLEGFTLKAAEKHTGTVLILFNSNSMLKTLPNVILLQVPVSSLGAPDHFEFAPILGILVAVVTVLLLLTLVILGVFKIRTSHRRNASQALRPGFLPVKEKVMLTAASESEDLFDKDDKNPDVVPANKGMFLHNSQLRC